MENPILSSGVASPQSIFEIASDAKHSLGTRGVLGDKIFYYGKAGASNLGIGIVTTLSARVTNHISCAWVSGGAIGSTKVTFTLGATAATENQYLDGELLVIDGTGSGQRRRVKYNPAHAGSGDIEVEVYEPFTIACGTGEISLIANQYNGILTTPGNAVVHVVGVPQCAVTAAYHAWFQTSGPAMVLGDGSTFAAGGLVCAATAGTADAGQITVTAEGGTGTGVYDAHIGRIIDIGDASSDLDFRYVDLLIRG